MTTNTKGKKTQKTKKTRGELNARIQELEKLGASISAQAECTIDQLQASIDLLKSSNEQHQIRVHFLETLCGERGHNTGNESLYDDAQALDKEEAAHRNTMRNLADAKQENQLLKIDNTGLEYDLAQEREEVQRLAELLKRQENPDDDEADLEARISDAVNERTRLLENQLFNARYRAGISDDKAKSYNVEISRLKDKLSDAKDASRERLEDCQSWRDMQEEVQRLRELVEWYESLEDANIGSEQDSHSEHGEDMLVDSAANEDDIEARISEAVNERSELLHRELQDALRQSSLSTQQANSRRSEIAHLRNTLSRQRSICEEHLNDFEEKLALEDQVRLLCERLKQCKKPSSIRQGGVAEDGEQGDADKDDEDEGNEEDEMDDKVYYQHDDEDDEDDQVSEEEGEDVEGNASEAMDMVAEPQAPTSRTFSHVAIPPSVPSLQRAVVSRCPSEDEDLDPSDTVAMINDAIREHFKPLLDDIANANLDIKRLQGELSCKQKRMEELLAEAQQRKEMDDELLRLRTHAEQCEREHCTEANVEARVSAAIDARTLALQTELREVSRQLSESQELANSREMEVKRLASDVRYEERKKSEQYRKVHGLEDEVQQLREQLASTPRSSSSNRRAADTAVDDRGICGVDHTRLPQDVNEATRASSDRPLKDLDQLQQERDNYRHELEESRLAHHADRDTMAELLKQVEEQRDANRALTLAHALVYSQNGKAGSPDQQLEPLVVEALARAYHMLMCIHLRNKPPGRYVELGYISARRQETAEELALDWQNTVRFDDAELRHWAALNVRTFGDEWRTVCRRVQSMHREAMKTMQHEQERSAKRKRDGLTEQELPAAQRARTNAACLKSKLDKENVEPPIESEQEVGFSSKNTLVAQPSASGTNNVRKPGESTVDATVSTMHPDWQAALSSINEHTGVNPSEEASHDQGNARSRGKGKGRQSRQRGRQGGRRGRGGRGGSRNDHVLHGHEIKLESG